jgi:hypothetical protein
MKGNLPMCNLKFVKDEAEIKAICAHLFFNHQPPNYLNTDFVDNEKFSFLNSSLPSPVTKEAEEPSYLSPLAEEADTRSPLAEEVDREGPREEIKDTNLLPITKGYFLEVDLTYPPHLHNPHIGLPLAPEHLNGKLIPNLRDKKNYKVHMETLELYVQLGIKVDKIHRVLSFDQTYYLREYIDFNTRMRKNSTNNMEKNMFKLMNNSIYGKTMEKIMGKMHTKLVSKLDLNNINKYIMDGNLKNFEIYNDNLVLLHFNKKDVVLEKPIYTGATILDLSKKHMYDMIYNVIF